VTATDQADGDGSANISSTEDGGPATDLFSVHNFDVNIAMDITPGSVPAMTVGFESRVEHRPIFPDQWFLTRVPCNVKGSVCTRPLASKNMKITAKIVQKHCANG